MPNFHIIDRTGAETIVAAPNMEAAIDRAHKWVSDRHWDESFVLELCIRKLDDYGETVDKRYIDVMVGKK
jgi:hypothetical protein